MTRRRPVAVALNTTAILEDAPDTSVGNVVRHTGLKRSTVQRILKIDLDLKRFAEIKAQRISTAHRGKRLEMREKWQADIESGALDLKKI